MSEQLVTIGRFPQPHVAELARGYLQAAGIPSVLLDVETATLRGTFLSVPATFARLQVLETDVPEAVRVLGEWEAAIRRAGERGESAAEERCLACGAPLSATDVRCRACGWTWETSGGSGQGLAR